MFTIVVSVRLDNAISWIYSQWNELRAPDSIHNGGSMNPLREDLKNAGALEVNANPDSTEFDVLYRGRWENDLESRVDGDYQCLDSFRDDSGAYWIRLQPR